MRSHNKANIIVVVVVNRNIIIIIKSFISSMGLAKRVLFQLNSRLMSAEYNCNAPTPQPMILSALGHFHPHGFKARHAC